ncbi:MAG: cytochrome c-550 [Oscillatoriales cyanobacterium SM2_2_1]|nr:cytochrome c-550 [Oscillatoriales cyanobacterium SM2_2_1]
MVWQSFAGSTLAADNDETLRTLPLDDARTVTLSPRELQKGKKLFQNACANCHLGGATLTNPNVGLDPETLSLANPPRNTILGMVDYMKNPTTFDGQEEIYEVHPSLRSTDIFPTMRGLTDKDLRLIAGYILYQPKVKGIGWGGGKVYY